MASDSDLEGPEIIATLHWEESSQTEAAPQPASTSPKSESIIWTNYDRPGGRITLHNQTTLRIGRARSNDLALNLPNVSRFHAIFSASTSGLVLSDLASTNGTYVNGNRISTPIDLRSGDRVDIGPVNIRVQLHLDDDVDIMESQFMATVADRMRAAGIVTVLVADIRDYTKMSETLPANDLIEMLQLWFHHAAEVVAEFGGEIDKYIGDCVMALWRSPEEVAKRYAVDACKAALALRERTLELSNCTQWIHRDRFPWRCRISLNTGKALIGAVGARGSRDFTVLGDTVNIAFRLDAIGGQLGHDFMLGETTAELAKEMVTLTSLGPINVKGKSEKIVVYTIA